MKLPQWYTLCTAQILYWTDPTYRALADLEDNVERYLHGFKWPEYLRVAHTAAWEHIRDRAQELTAELEDDPAVKG